MVQAPERTTTNGRDGHLSDEMRRGLVALAIFGSSTDARAAFLALPGASLESWNDFDRAVSPMRAFVQEGEEPYVKPLMYVDIWEGVKTPAGDCAEDAMPLEFANPDRRSAEAEWFEQRN